MKLYNLLIMICISLSFFTCKKDEGEGGRGVITGKVYAKDYSSFGSLIGEFFAPEERVYIIYGDGNVFDDDTRTSYDGTYEFKYLRKGEYTVFVYSDCDTCASGTEAKMEKVKISKLKQTVEVPTITIRK